MNERLATIEKITEIKPIEGADRIVAAKVLGFWTVIKKEEGNVVGSLICWHNPDTIVDKEKDCYKFLEKNHWRLKVCKFKGQISQGLALPLKDLFNIAGKTFEVKEGDDVTEIIHLTKYEKLINPALIGKIKGNFPGFIRKTDELNARSYPKVIEEIKGKPYYCSIKNDGSSLSFYYRNSIYGCCTRNLEKLFDENDSHWKIGAELDLENKLKQFGFNICIQGEFVGPGVNGNKMKLSKFNYSVFNVYDIDNSKYLDYRPAFELCNKFNIPTVKVIEDGDNFNYSIEELIEKSNNLTYESGELAEGLVCRSQIEQYSNILDGRLSFKIISEKFALKHGE